MRCPGAVGPARSVCESSARALLLPRSMDSPRDGYVQALHRAAETLGGEARLACFLGVAGAQLRRWLDGGESVPLSVFLTTLDVIADGPYAGTTRRVRVAAIRDACSAKSTRR